MSLAAPTLPSRARTDRSPIHTAPQVQRPKEHGAYAMLAVPAVTALCMGGLSWVAVATIVASIAGFMANEPLMIMAGCRGNRAKSQNPRATQWTAILLSVTVLAGCSALSLGSSEVRLALLVCFLAATVCFMLTASGHQRSFGFQIGSVVGLTLPSLVILLGGGMTASDSLAIWSAWVIGLGVAVVSVRSVVAGQKTSMGKCVPIGYDLFQASLTCFAIAGITFGNHSMIAILPLLCVAWLLRLARPAARYLRQVGWTLVACNVLSAIGMIALNWPAR